MKIERTTKVYSSSSSPSRSMLKSSRVGAGIISDASNEVRVSCDSSFISAPFMSSGVSSFRRRITKKITKTTITATTTKTTTTAMAAAAPFDSPFPPVPPSGPELPVSVPGGYDSSISPELELELSVGVGGLVGILSGSHS